MAQLGVDAKGIDAITERGRSPVGEIVELDVGRFLDAACTIKSSIDSLNARGVADMAEIAAITSRATVGDTNQMADFRAKAHGIFKAPLFLESDAKKFAGAIGSAMTKSAQAFLSTGPK